MTGARLVGTALVAVALTLTGSVGAAPAAAQAGERIVSYHVALRIEASGQLVIEETIDYDFGPNQRHGILRDVVVRLRYDDRYDRVYPLDVLRVSASEGTPHQHRVEDGPGGTARIRVGDPDRTISGRHRYVLLYRVSGALNAFDSHDELYWNVIGGQWQVPIEAARAELVAPSPLGRIACFAGPAGSSLPCAQAAAFGETAHFVQPRLAPFEAMTVVVALPKGAVPAPVPRLEERWSFQRAFSVTTGTVGAAGALMMALLAAIGALAWRHGRDRRYVGSHVDVVFGSAQHQHVPLGERAITPVEFAPPDGLRPGQVGVLIDERAQPLDVTATIVDLAARGYLRIEEIPKSGWFGKDDWRLVKVKGADDLRSYESRLFTSLFSGSDTVVLSSLRNTFAARLKQVQEALYRDAVDQGWFPARPDHIRVLWIGIAIGVTVAGAALVVAAARFSTWGIVPLPLVVAGLVLLVTSRWMPHRTPKGTAALRRTLGFRRFIEESEAERARFAERQHLFSEYLPYAVVFGATDKWARAFAGLDGEVPQPPWYVSSRPFTASAFSSSIDGFTVSTAGTIASTPSGSGSSGFSGGSAGGGGGGGGGGSW